jgi:hypothetical protein
VIERVRHCPNPDCPFARGRGRPAEYRADAARCSDCGAELSDDPIAPPEPSGPVTAATWGRLAVTAAAPIAMLAVSLAPLPGVGMGAGSVVGAAFQPIVESFLAVELAAWLVPPWRALRERPSGRAILTLLALALSLALCALQGLNSGLMLERWGHAAPWTPILYAAYLVSGALVVWGLALLVDRRGLGGGFALLLVVAMGGRELAGVERRLQESSIAPAQVAMLLGVYGILATATVWLLRSRRAEPVREPAAGVLPVLGASWLAATIWTLSLLAETWLRTSRLPPYFRPDGTPYVTFELVIAALLSIGVGFALHRRALPAARLKPAILRGVLFSVLLLLAPAWVTLGSGLDRVPAAVAVVFAAALWEDFRREIAARRRDPTLASVWPVRTTAAATRALESLRSHGIAGFSRGEAMHAMLHVFGPFLPISILVSAARATGAKGILTSALPPSSGS